MERQDGKQMIFVLPHFWIIFLDIFLWLVIHLGISYACSKIPIGKFDPQNRFYRPKSFEKGGKLYTRIFKIKKWKNIVPDGAKLFRGGFPKKILNNAARNTSGLLRLRPAGANLRTGSRYCLRGYFSSGTYGGPVLLW